MDVKQQESIMKRIETLVFPANDATDEDKALLSEVLAINNERLRGYLRLKEVDTLIPLELEYILVETSIARFNYISSEGMSEETTEGHKAVYIDPFKQFMSAINEWLLDNEVIERTPRPGKVMFF